MIIVCSIFDYYHYYYYLYWCELQPIHWFQHPRCINSSSYIQLLMTDIGLHLAESHASLCPKGPVACFWISNYRSATCSCWRISCVGYDESVFLIIAAVINNNIQVDKRLHSATGLTTNRRTAVFSPTEIRKARNFSTLLLYRMRCCW